MFLVSLESRSRHSRGRTIFVQETTRHIAEVTSLRLLFPVESKREQVSSRNVNLRMSYFSRVKNFGYFIYFLNAIKARGAKSTDSRKRNAQNSP